MSDASHDRMHGVCESAGLSPGLMKALLSIKPGEVKPMKALTTEWRCDASYVTSLVDGLEERGIVERRAHPTDRRAKTIALTSQGEQTREELLHRLYDPPPLLAALTPTEQRTLRDLLQKLLAAAEGVDSARSSAWR